MSPEQMQKNLDWLDSPEGQASIEEHVNRWIAQEDATAQRIEKLEALSQEDFDSLMSKLVKRNDGAWTLKCHMRGRQAYGTPVLNLVFSAAHEKGREVSEDEFWVQTTQYFSATVYEYRGWYFWAIYGQGVHERVYDKNREQVIHL